MKSTPIKTMEQITNIQTLEQRRDTKILQQAEKYLCDENNPMRNRMGELARGRLQRSSFIHKAKRLRRQYSNQLPTKVSLLSRVPEEVPWEDPEVKVEVKTTIPGIFSKQNQNDIELRTAALATIEEEYPSESWTRAYTDGSADNAVNNGGAGIYIEHPDKSIITRAIPTGTYCTNYKAEIQAIMTATSELKLTPGDCQQVVFLTDASAVLTSFQNNKIPELRKALGSLNNTRIVLQWIPSHCGIPGNEKADKLAKQGSNGSQENKTVTYKEIKNIIKNTRKPPEPPQDSYHLLDRQGQVIIFRLRTGHNRLKHHMYKLKIGTTPKCACGELQTTEHILQVCRELEGIRAQHWPEESNTNSKLYGTLQELQNTVGFILNAGIAV